MQMQFRFVYFDSKRVIILLLSHSMRTLDISDICFFCRSLFYICFFFSFDLQLKKKYRNAIVICLAHYLGKVTFRLGLLLRTPVEVVRYDPRTKGERQGVRNGVRNGKSQ
jgi:hypothetical protein